MTIWISLLIPIIGAVVLGLFFADKVTWQRLVIPFCASIAIIMMMKLIGEAIEVSDTEYLGQLAYKAEYYEPWETYVHATCTRQVACGTDSKGQTIYCSESYDCSYCDDHRAKWQIVDDGGHRYDISEGYYTYLCSRWSSKPEFVEMNRNITHHFSCGKDGDMYQIFWDKKVLTSVPTVRAHMYENRVKVATSSFNYCKISKEDVERYHLYDYPTINGFTQPCILGAEQFGWISATDREVADRYSKYLCGYLGPKRQLKLWVLLYKDCEAISANMQEAYWVNGNKNEVVICIGLKGNNNRIQWVRPFSWTTNRTLLVNLREDIMRIGVYHFHSIYPVLEHDLQRFDRKHFKEFKYISVEPPTWSVIIAYVLILAGNLFYYIYASNQRPER